MKSALMMFLPGAVFGIGLGVSGMTNPAKVVGFLDMRGAWDPSLAFVMVGAIGVFAIANALIHRRPTPLFGSQFPGVRAIGAIDGRLFAGAILFGIGWGVSGICPGPALANLSRLRPDVLTFIATMSVGMIIAQRVLHADAKPPATAATAKPSTPTVVL